MNVYCIFEHERLYIPVAYGTVNAARRELDGLLKPYPKDSNWRFRLCIRYVPEHEFKKGLRLFREHMSAETQAKAESRRKWWAELREDKARFEEYKARKRAKEHARRAVINLDPVRRTEELRKKRERRERYLEALKTDAAAYAEYRAKERARKATLRSSHK